MHRVLEVRRGLPPSRNSQGEIPVAPPRSSNPSRLYRMRSMRPHLPQWMFYKRLSK